MNMILYLSAEKEGIMVLCCQCKKSNHWFALKRTVVTKQRKKASLFLPLFVICTQHDSSKSSTIFSGQTPALLGSNPVSLPHLVMEVV